LHTSLPLMYFCKGKNTTLHSQVIFLLFH
jgi:hypothetical protein